jgi:hypothetical protein
MIINYDPKFFIVQATGLLFDIRSLKTTTLSLLKWSSFQMNLIQILQNKIFMLVKITFFPE